MYSRRLIAIDPSLRSSGWALFNVESEKILGIGKVKSLSASFPLGDRIADLQQKIENLYQRTKLCDNDVLICEAPTTMRDPQAAFKVEQVRSTFEALARKYGATVPGRLNPRSIQIEVMGLKSGKQLERKVVKQTAACVAINIYKEQLNNLGFELDFKNYAKHQDIIDALLVGSLALTRLKQALVAKISLSEFFDNDLGARVAKRFYAVAKS